MSGHGGTRFTTGRLMLGWSVVGPAAMLLSVVHVAFLFIGVVVLVLCGWGTLLRLGYVTPSVALDAAPPTPGSRRSTSSGAEPTGRGPRPARADGPSRGSGPATSARFMIERASPTQDAGTTGDLKVEAPSKERHGERAQLAQAIAGWLGDVSHSDVLDAPVLSCRRLLIKCRDAMEEAPWDASEWRFRLGEAQAFLIVTGPSETTEQPGRPDRFVRAELLLWAAIIAALTRDDVSARGDFENATAYYEETGSHLQAGRALHEYAEFCMAVHESDLQAAGSDAARALTAAEQAAARARRCFSSGGDVERARRVALGADLAREARLWDPSGTARTVIGSASGRQLFEGFTALVRSPSE